LKTAEVKLVSAVAKDSLSALLTDAKDTATAKKRK
jgi:hypothetical protein